MRKKRDREEVSQWQYRREKCPKHAEIREEATTPSSLCPDLLSAPTPLATRCSSPTAYARFAATTTARRFSMLKRLNWHERKIKGNSLLGIPFYFLWSVSNFDLSNFFMILLFDEEKKWTRNTPTNPQFINHLNLTLFLNCYCILGNNVV